MPDSNFEDLTGKLLIASPYSMLNEVFNKSIIYVVSHNSSGALGIIVNRLVNKVNYQTTIRMFKDENDGSAEIVMPVHIGGPVEPERGFILHTAEYDKNLLLKFPDNLAISSNVEIIKDIAKGSGPANSIFVLGYTGWFTGQLEEEMKNNLWLVSECDQQILFSKESDKKWYAALDRMGISDSLFAPEIGHC
jgi:putative transcriptional regulator